MNKIINFISSLYKYVVIGLFCIISLWLLMLSIFSTSYMTYGGTEYTYYVGDKPYIHVIVFLTIFLIACTIHRCGYSKYFIHRLNDNNNFFIRSRNILLLLITLLGLFWVLVTQTKTGADQYYVMNAAYCLRNGDPTPFLKDGYIAKYTNQIGLVFIYYLLGYIVGDYNNIFFQLLNVVMVTITFKWITDILNLFKAGRTVQLVFLSFALLFYPWILYSTFVYGNVPGMFFSIGAFLFAYRFFNNKKYSHAVICAFFIMMGIMVKSNYLIFLIALIIYVIITSLRKRSIPGLVLLGLIIVGFIIQSTVPKYIVSKKSGCDLNAGASAYAWIAMGTQTITGDYYADGWYSPKIAALYELNDYDTEAEKLAAIEVIDDNINYFKDNPGSFTTFLAKKTASQWNNPAFQSFWIVYVRNTSITQPQWVKNAIGVNGNYLFFEFLNIMQTIILTGNVVFAFGMAHKKKYFGLLLLPTTVIGGFIFHTFWEGKCQYTIPYFMLLLPLAAMGYSYLFKKINSFIDWIVTTYKLSKEKNTPALKAHMNKSRKSIIITAAATIIILVILILPSCRRWYVLDYDNDNYKNYIIREKMSD
ncbi:MAG: hypothetical protein ACI4E1_14240 [Lachnospira sp.]